MYLYFFFFSSRRRHTRWPRDWSSDVCSSDLRYVPHKEEFEKYYQPDLAALYAQEPPPTPLGFAFGYHWQKEDGILMVAEIGRASCRKECRSGWWAYE